MKLSIYNIFFHYNGKIIGYNSLADNFVILEPNIYLIFLCNENNVDKVQAIHPDLYNLLIDKGFIIPQITNELDRIKEISEKTDFDDTKYELTVIPTINCNFSCWYCYETHIKGSKMSEETITKVTALIQRIVENQSKLQFFDLQWFGGEPLLYFKKIVEPVLELAFPLIQSKEIKFTSGFTTNGYLINQQMLTRCKDLGVTHFQITLDGNRERHNQVRFISNKKGSYDKIVTNIKLCAKNQFTIVVRINISEATLDNLDKIIDDFVEMSKEQRKFVNFSFHKVWQEKKDLSSLVKPIIEKFRDSGFRTSYKSESTASIFNSCYADKKNHATINYNGDVFTCTARSYDTENREGMLKADGNIDWYESYYKRIEQSRFRNKPCLNCKILPICNGGCSQHRLEYFDEHYCIHNFNEQEKMDLVKEKFFALLNNND